MPVYNSGEYLKTAVESILSQSLREIELILVDDGSTDGSSERCDEYARNDCRIVVIHQRNGGICAARNAALEIAQGEYIGFSDHDDEYSPGQIQDNYERIVKSGADIIKFGSQEVITVGDNVVRNIDRAFTDTVLTQEVVRQNFWKLWRGRVMNCCWDTLFRRDFLKKNDIRFNTYFKAGSEDFDFLWHCIGCGAKIELSSKVYYRHYIRTGISTSAKYNAGNIKMCIERPEILFGYVQSMRMSLETQETEYTYFFLEMVLGALCHVIAHPQCELSAVEKTSLIASLRKQPYYKDFIQHVSPLALWRISKHRYTLLLWLFQHKMYAACLWLYERQYKKRNIK